MTQIGAATKMQLAHVLRQKDGQRHSLDTYLTSASLALRMVHLSYQRWHAAGGSWHTDDPVRVADLGAGVGIFGIAAWFYFQAIGVPAEIIGFDINPAFPKTEFHDAWYTRDVLTLQPQDHGLFDLINMNPPFDTETLKGFIRTARSLLTKAGQVTVLAPSRFEFHRYDFFMEGHYFTRRIVLDRRPAFYQLLLDGNQQVEPIPVKKNNKGEWIKPSARQTDVHECCIYCFDATDHFPDKDDFWQWEFKPSEVEGYQEYFPGEAEMVDAIHAAAQASPGMPVYYLIYEASRRQDGSLVFDDLWSLLTARTLGWYFVQATDVVRVKRRTDYRAQVLGRLADQRSKQHGQ